MLKVKARRIEVTERRANCRKYPPRGDGEPRVHKAPRGWGLSQGSRERGCSNLSRPDNAASRKSFSGSPAYGVPRCYFPAALNSRQFGLVLARRPAELPV